MVTLGFTAGCDRLKGDDAVAKLKSHAVCLEKHLRERKSNYTNPNVIEDVAFDVRKTDSLTSPFVGTIGWVEKNRSLDGSSEFRMSLAYQENLWNLKAVQWRMIFNEVQGRPASVGEWKDLIDDCVKGGALYSRETGKMPPAELTEKGALHHWTEKLVCN